MQSRNTQAGMSVLGTLVVLIMVGFFALSAIRMAPPYFEYLSVRDILSRAATDPESADASISALRMRFETVFNTNQIEHLEAREMDIFRKEGKTYIDARYEVRLPVVGIIDAVLRFDDLIYVIGQGEPIPADQAPARD